MRKIINMYFATHKTCNLSCEYCYVPKESTINKKVSDEEILASLDEFISKVESENYEIASFCLHGTEPTLMSAEAMAEICLRVQDHRQRMGKDRGVIALQSNGVRLNKDYLTVLKSKINTINDIRLGFSIDPPKEMHDKYRNKSWDKVVNNLNTAIKMGFKTSILAVLHKESMSYLKEFYDWINYYLHLNKENANPYKIKAKLATGSLEPSNSQINEFAEFLIENKLEHLMQILTPGYCLQSGNDCMWYEFDILGNSYSCNKTYNSDGIFTNWKQESFDDIERKRRNLYSQFPVHAECSKCTYEFICNSGCPVDRIKTGELKGKAHECEIIKQSFANAEKNGIHLVDFYNSNDR